MKKTKNGLFTIRGMVFTAIFAAIICVAAPFSVQVGPIPITLATFAIYLAGAILGGKRGMAAVAVYIMIGAVGIPVFSNFNGGFGALLGPTGGYIIGYIPLVFLTGIFAEMNSKKHWTMIVGMLLGTAALYAFGTAWYMIMSGKDLLTALSLCALPFIPGDAVKIVCTAAVAMPLNAKLNAAMFGNNGTE
ncbi:MAG: biotin transporter BioY [Oscillospiraceae bacterium]|nr:biotin transporter BioY [Oscillospiraceae bacterium]